MRKRTMLIAVLAAVVWASVGAFVSADDYVLSITNRSDMEIVVSVFWQKDHLQWIPCEDPSPRLSPGETVYIPDRDWPGCGFYDEFMIKVYEESYDYGDGMTRLDLLQIRTNIPRGSHVDIVRTW